MDELRRIGWKLNKRAYRQKVRAPVCPSVQKTIVLLVRMGAPWECIQEIAMMQSRKNNSTLPITELSIEKLKAVAVSAQKKWGGGCQGLAEESDNKRIVDTKSEWFRWSTAQWLKLQNMKGLSMPSRVAVDRYIQQWGPGPHPATIAAHLEKFKAKHYRKRWLRSVRQDWGFSYSVLPARGVDGLTKLR